MSMKVIIENTDANRNLEVFHNPDDGWGTTITPGGRVGCVFGNGEELVIRRTNLTQDMIPEPVAVDDDAVMDGSNGGDWPTTDDPFDGANKLLGNK